MRSPTNGSARHATFTRACSSDWPRCACTSRVPSSWQGHRDDGSLDEIARGIDAAMSELRDAHLPGRADTHREPGLGAALGADTSGAPIAIAGRRSRLRRRHPMRAELAVYFACREAAQNSIKHAGSGSDGMYRPDRLAARHRVRRLGRRPRLRSGGGPSRRGLIQHSRAHRDRPVAGSRITSTPVPAPQCAASFPMSLSRRHGVQLTVNQ